MGLVLTLLVTHFIADFLFQSDWMALNKSKWHESRDGFRALGAHVLVYGACLLVIGGWRYALLNALLHWATDALTSQATTRLWFIDLRPNPMPSHQSVGNGWPYEFVAHVVPHRRHWFFVAIGFDQLVHAVTLISTSKFFVWTWLTSLTLS